MKIIAPVLLIVLSGVVVALSVCAPNVLARNGFLVGFVNHEIIAVLGVIMTITIATIATIHLWFNELEKKSDKPIFGDARREINQSSMSLIAAFVVMVVLLITRSYFDGNMIATSLFNGFAIIILFFAVTVLIDIMGVITSLTPRK